SRPSPRPRTNGCSPWTRPSPGSPPRTRSPPGWSRSATSPGCRSRTRPPPSASPARRPTATGPTPAPGSGTPSPRPGPADEVFPESVRRPAGFLALGVDPNQERPMSTDPKRVKEIFLEAAELPDEAARAAFLDRACGGDAGLRARVEALLRSHDPAGSFLGTPAAAIPDPGLATTMAHSTSTERHHAATLPGDEAPRGDDDE